MDKNIYKGLECQCSEFERIPINRRELGMAGEASSYTLSIAVALGEYKVNSYLNTQGVSNGIKNLSSIKINANAGILNFLFKKVEGKENKRALVETGIETSASIITAKIAKVSISLGVRILTGAATGAVAGSAFPIVGTIIGAVAGTLIAGFINENIFSDEDKALAEANAQNERLKEQEERYSTKINRINDYLIRHNYIELRELDESEAEALCKEISNIDSSYFKTILLMLSFTKYLDTDKAFYKSLSSSAESKKDTKPIANAILLTLEIKECYDSNKGELLKDTTIYIYNHRFQRVVAKGLTDSKGYLKIENVSVGKEIGIDKISFIINRDNLDENNFELSKAQYATMSNIQKKHKDTKIYKANKIYLGFNNIQSKLHSNYEVNTLKVQHNDKNIALIAQSNITDTRFKQYIKFSYLVFDVADTNVDRYIANICIENRQNSGLNNLGNGLVNTYPIKRAWDNKILAIFAYCDSQIHTPYTKISFMKPVIILDIGDSKALGYEQESMKMKDIVLNITTQLKERLQKGFYPIILGCNDENVKQRVKIANTIKHNIQNDNILLLSLHIDSDESEKVSGMRCFYNAKKYKKEEENFIANLKTIMPHKNNTHFSHKNNAYIAEFTAMPSVLITLGFISNGYDKKRLNDKNYRNIIVSSINYAINATR